MLSFLFITLLPILGHAHSGGTDAYGCHHDRKNGGYHCHNPKKVTEPKTSHELSKKVEQKNKNHSHLKKI